MKKINRRRFLISAAAGSALAGCAEWGWRAPEKGPIAAVFPQPVEAEAMQAAYQGLLRVRDEMGIPILVLQSAADSTAISQTLRSAAESEPALILAIGEMCAAPARQIAVEFPQQRFTLIQSEAEASGAKLNAYLVLQQQSAWLAGAFAGLFTRRSMVGQIGAVRDSTALKARAAFIAGYASALPKARFLSNFGTDIAKLARAQIDAGADVIFLTQGTPDAALIALARERNIRLIGHGRDWVAQTPDVYAASAVFDPGVAVLQCAHDLYDALWKSGLIHRIGVGRSEAVRLTLAQDIDPAIAQRMDLYQREMMAGAFKIPESYDGPEFRS
jgi:basic membrane protein A